MRGGANGTGSGWLTGLARLPIVLGALLLVTGVVVAVRAVTTGDDRAERPAAEGSRRAPPGTVEYELRGGGAGPVRVRLEVAATVEQRRQGLSGRPSLAPGTGMVFLFPQDTTGNFWMKDTLVPLSIAFVAADGRVVSVSEMTPCRQDPCRTYPPAGPYRYAVELPAGAFAGAGVGPGDQVVPLQPEALPTPA
jgi:uncharacterized membrane protein (UPF0127 family)